MKKLLPIGIDSFREIRETGRYYVDKTLIIRDFIKRGDKAALVMRPRCFGKTLNMTTIQEFFDITKDSKGIFEGLAIMGTEYSDQINSRPVLFFSFSGCKAGTAEELLLHIAEAVAAEYAKYHHVFNGTVDRSKRCYRSFYQIYEKLLDRSASKFFLQISISDLEKAVCDYYKIDPIVLIDEYDTPMLSAAEHGYQNELSAFFSGFYGSALKGQDSLHQALLTGMQRMAKESIFSGLNNIMEYTAIDEPYSQYFGLTAGETGELLSQYGIELCDEVKQKYNGHRFGGTEAYNPCSILHYADTGELGNYWIGTPGSFLIGKLVKEADRLFKKGFEKLIAEGVAEIGADLRCSFFEFAHADTLWGLLVNAGYLTVVSREVGSTAMTVRIPSGETKAEFMKVVADYTGVESVDLQSMLQCSLNWDTEGFVDVYQEIVQSCTGYFDEQENAYRMLFLGMCISLSDLYKITSNMEAGLGRSDIRMESLSLKRPHIVIEFKQGEDIDGLKEEALAQIMENRYFAGLSGECLCIGIAHDKKRCAAARQLVQA
ncbi:MAG: ATP-binding protein [Clostridiales bacterium]|nr:ATP-binding protein [Clostridiales bacterium]